MRLLFLLLITGGALAIPTEEDLPSLDGYDKRVSII